MYVKLFQGILHSSIARNTALRRFFQDLLLLCDRNGDVIMTKDSIAIVLRVPIEEVEWGIAELQKADPDSKNGDEDGRRLIPIEGLGYGWHVVNYGFYRGIKDAEEMREAHRVRQAAYAARKKASSTDAADTQLTRMTEMTPSEADAYSEADAEATAPINSVDEGFETFWSKYPRKVGKGTALRVWKRLAKDDKDCALKVIEELRRVWDSAAPDRRRFCPHPTTWLNRRGWEDDIHAVEVQAEVDKADGPRDEKDPWWLEEQKRTNAKLKGESS